MIRAGRGRPARGVTVRRILLAALLYISPTNAFSYGAVSVGVGQNGRTYYAVTVNHETSGQAMAAAKSECNLSIDTQDPSPRAGRCAIRSVFKNRCVAVTASKPFLPSSPPPSSYYFE